MRKAITICLLFLSAATATAAQQASASVQAPVPEAVKLANGAAGLVDPILLPLIITPPPDSGCDGVKRSGKVQFSLVADAQGRPRNIVFDEALANELDYLAARLVENDRFQPAMLDGAPVAVAGTVELNLESCELIKTDGKGHKSLSLRVRSIPVGKFEALPHASDTVNLAPIDPPNTPQPIEKVGGSVLRPIPINQVQAEFSDYARAHHIQGTCLFSVIVDEHGLPQDFQVARPIDPSLQQEASEAVHKYRFKPATRDGIPVPVRIMIEVSFKSLD
jgi:TonB family protein